MNKIICADVLDGLKQIPDNYVSLMCCSPPYCLSISYDNHDDNTNYFEYLKWLKNVFSECKRTLRIGGRFAINMATITNRQEDKDKEYIRILGKYLGNMMEEIGMLSFAEIVWYKQDAAGKKTAWGSWCSSSCPIVRSTHEFIYVFSKDKFSLDGDSEQSDMTPEEFNEYTFSTWFIPPETARDNPHPVPYPLGLVKRIIKLYSYRGDVVLDPFVGSGTTCLAAYLLGRQYIGIDNSRKYCDFAENRIREAKIDIEMQLDQEPYIPRFVRLKEHKNKGNIEMEDLY